MARSFGTRHRSQESFALLFKFSGHRDWVAPISAGLGAVPDFVRVHRRFHCGWPGLEKIRCGRVEVSVPDNRGRDEDEEIVLIKGFIFTAESISKNRDVTQKRNLGI